MINEIQINRLLATYLNPENLNDLRRINYISGANGTREARINHVISSHHGIRRLHLP